MKKKYFTLCIERYLSKEWHERTKQGWMSYRWIHDNTEVIMCKEKLIGETRQPTLLQITRRDGRDTQSKES